MNQRLFNTLKNTFQIKTIIIKRFRRRSFHRQGRHKSRYEGRCTDFDRVHEWWVRLIFDLWSRFDLWSLQPCLIFDHCSANGNGTVEKVVGIARDLRTTYQTQVWSLIFLRWNSASQVWSLIFDLSQIIAIGLNATQDGQRLTKEVIGVSGAVRASITRVISYRFSAWCTIATFAFFWVKSRLRVR